MTKFKTLGDVCDAGDAEVQTGPFGSQLHESDYVEEGVPVVMPKDISNGKIDEDSVARVSEQKANSLPRHTLRALDIVMPRRGEINKRALITPEQAGYMCGTGCVRISLFNGSVDPVFFYYYLDQPQIIRWIEQRATGSTMLNLNTSIVKSIPLPPIDFDTQRRIATILSAYDDLIENNRKRIKLLERAARLLYTEWFVRMRFPGYEGVKVKDGVPEGWELSSFGDLVSQVKHSVRPEDVDADTPYIGLEHIPRRALVLDTWGNAEDVTSNKFAFQADDILFGKIRPYFHKVGFAITDGITSSDAIVMRPTEEAFGPLALSVASSDHFVAVASKSAKEGSKMPRADWKQMQAYPVMLPSTGVMEQFNDVIRPSLSMMKVLAKQNIQLTRARDLLLPRLMSGKVKV
jgi:type I restriction enzyme, S subunit